MDSAKNAQTKLKAGPFRRHFPIATHIANTEHITAEPRIEIVPTGPDYAPPPTTSHPKVFSPHSIAELGVRAKQSLGDDVLSFRTWLRLAESAERNARKFQKEGNLESAYIEFARAATILLEKVPSHPEYGVLLTSTERHDIGLRGQRHIDSLAKVKFFLTEFFDQRRVDLSSAQIQTVSHLYPRKLAARRSIRSHGINTTLSPPTPANASDSQVARKNFHTNSKTRTKDSSLILERHKQVVAFLPRVGSDQGSEPSDDASVAPTKVAGASEASEVTAEALNRDEESSLETDTSVYHPSFTSSYSSIPSYKTEKTVNSRKSHYNALPRRKYANIGRPKLPPHLVSKDVNEAASVPKSEVHSIQAPQLKPWLKSPSPLTELRTNVVAGTPADPGPSRAARRNNVLFGASHSEESLTFQPTLPSPPAKSRLMNVVIGTPTDPEPSSATQRNNARALFGASDSEESVTSASLQPTDGWPTMGQPPRSETSSGPRSLRETLLPSSPSGVLSSSATEKRGKDKQELAVEVRREAKGATSQLKKIPTSEMANEASSYKKRIDASQISVLANFEESGPNLGGQHLYRPLRIHGSSSYGLSIVKAASHLERTLNGWASEVLRIAPTPAVALQEAVLTDTTHVGENTALFTVVRPMTVHYLLRHALAQVISEGIINSLLVTNSVEANLGFTRAHERLLTRDAKAATFWRRLTFSIAVENPTPEMMRLIFEQNMPLLAALLPDSAEDALGTRTMLRAAFRFSCMLRGENANSEAFYSSFVPKVTSTLDLGVIDLVKPCRRSERGEVDRVGVTIFPGLIEVMPMLPTGVVRMVVRRAQVICECELLATSDPV